MKPTTASFPSIIARICSVQDAAEQLGLRGSMVKGYCSTGKLRAAKLGRSWIIDRQSVKQLSKSRKVAK
jgi:excisionase family DNA binding protein